jgi:L,D-transpeptidase catalytic domain
MVRQTATQGRRLGVAAAAALGALVIVSGASTARGPTLGLAWTTPSPRDGAVLTVTAGSPLTVELAAAGSKQAGLVVVGNRGLPAGARFASALGNRGTATLSWTPAPEQIGQHVLTFTAQTRSLPRAYARPRTLLVEVQPAAPAAPTDVFAFSAPGGGSRSAYVHRSVSVRTEPNLTSKVVARLHTVTPEHEPNLVLALAGKIDENGVSWVRVRLSILPNGSTGWVPRSALGGFRIVYTRLIVDRGLFTATLYRRGRAIFRSHVGVGKSFWPTPKGEFYVREKLTGFSDPVYGSLAFGTSARSNVLTDWLNGGFIGIHGTNQPEILPGRVSHGCIRMPNAAITRLARLMPLGTPITIT